MTQDDSERIGIVESQIGNFKWLIGGVAVLVMAVSFSLGGWILAEGKGVSELTQKVEFQGKEIDKHDQKIEASNQKVNEISGDIKATKTDIGYIKTALEDIKSILKSINK